MKPYSLKDYIELLIETKYKTNEVKSNTYRTDKIALSILENNFTNILNKNPKDITIDDVNTILNSDFSSSTKTKFKSLIKNSLDYAVEDEIINTNIMRTKSHKIYKIKKQRLNKDVISLTLKEQEKFLQAIEKLDDTYLYKWLWLFELYLGLRAGESLALFKSDIDLNNKTISITKTMTRDTQGKEILGNDTKTYAGHRILILNDSNIFIVHQALKFSYKNSPFLFFEPSTENPNKNCMTVASSYNRFRRFFKNNDILENSNKPVKQHMLRHTYATRLIESGVPAEVVQKQLGHANINVTLDTYTDVFDKYQKSFNTQITQYTKENNILYGNMSDMDTLALSDLNDIKLLLQQSRVDNKLKSLLLNEIDKVIILYQKNG